MGDAFASHGDFVDPVARKVLIIGAGPVGATLGQILRQNQIPFEIFDRDPFMNSRRGGTFILDGSLPHFMPLLPKDMGDITTISSNYNVGVQDTMAFINGIKGAVGMKQGAVPRGNPGFAISARRADLREWMCQNMPVYFNKRLSRYEEDAKGVTAYFEDGTHARGAILVGADGASSVVRRQLLGNPAREINRHVPICGSVELEKEAYEPMHALGNSMIVANSLSCHVMIAQMDIDPDRERARFWWLCTFVSEDPESDSDWVVSAEPKDLFRKVLEISKDLPEVVVETLRRTGPEGLWNPQIKFTEFVPPEALPMGRVTLIGDAAHNAAPFGGRGVNCGLQDAAELGQILSDKQFDGGEGVMKLLKRYEEKMIPRGRSVVMDARNKGDCKHLLSSAPPPTLPPGYKRLERPIPLQRADWTKSHRMIAELEQAA